MSTGWRRTSGRRIDIQVAEASGTGYPDAADPGVPGPAGQSAQATEDSFYFGRRHNLMPAGIFLCRHDSP